MFVSFRTHGVLRARVGSDTGSERGSLVMFPALNIASVPEGEWHAGFWSLSAIQIRGLGNQAT